MLGTGGQQPSHHLSNSLQQSSHHQNISAEDEGTGSNSVGGGRNQNRYLRDYHQLSSAHHHLNNPQGLPPPPTSHHTQDIHAGFDHLGGGGQDTFEDRYQSRPPVDLSYIRNSGGAGQGPYSPEGAQGVPDHWTAPPAAQQLLDVGQRYFSAADGLHQSAVSQGNPLGWPTPAEHQGHHHHHQHHRFGGAMGHAAAAAAALVTASNMKEAWGHASSSSSLNMSVGGAVNNSGRPGSAMSGKSKLCSPTSYRYYKLSLCNHYINMLNRNQSMISFFKF